jgi:hypothetical protein
MYIKAIPNHTNQQNFLMQMSMLPEISTHEVIIRDKEGQPAVSNVEEASVWLV